MTRDESWLDHYDSAEKKVKHETPALWLANIQEIHNAILCKQQKTFYLTVFWHDKHVCIAENLETVMTINYVRYIETLNNMRRIACRVRKSAGQIILQHDNASETNMSSYSQASSDLEFPTRFTLLIRTGFDALRFSVLTVFE